MSVSHASVHPVEDPSPTTEGGNNNEDENGNNAPARIRMKDIQGMPGTKGGLFLRVAQFFFSTAALLVMATTSDFPSVTAFWFDSDVYCISYLVAASGLQCLWSLSLAIVDIYALSVLRSLQNHQVVCLFAIGDGVTSTLTFAAACASAGITVLIDNDLDNCAQNHCIQFETATAMAFISWFTTLPSFLFNFWSLASR
ncbi:CASP-like protein 5A2 [Linum perenne]